VVLQKEFQEKQQRLYPSEFCFKDVNYLKPKLNSLKCNSNEVYTIRFPKKVPALLETVGCDSEKLFLLSLGLSLSPETKQVVTKTKTNINCNFIILQSCSGAETPSWKEAV